MTRHASFLLCLCAIACGAPPRGEVLASGQAQIANLVVGGASLYFTSSSDSTAYRVLEVPSSGGTPTVAAIGNVISTIGADAVGAYWLDKRQEGLHVIALATGASTAKDLGLVPNSFYGALGNVSADATA